MQFRTVSGWTIGMHIRHCALVMVLVCRGLNESQASPARKRWRSRRALVFLTKWIPRGTRKAPDFVVPDEAQPREELLQALNEAHAAVAAACRLDAGRWIPHPNLGPLSRDEALKFLLIHNRHHLKIIRDIQRGVPAGIHSSLA